MWPGHFGLMLTRTLDIMRTHHLLGFAAATVTLTVLTSTSGQAQINTTLTDKDRAEIQAIAVTYREALLTCKGEQYADLFATPGGYFASPSRGEVREKKALMEMVGSYDRCDAPPAKAPTGGGGPVSISDVKIEPAPEGAKALVPYTRGGGYYDDVYVKTPKGWKFKSRNVVSEAEIAVGFLAKDAIEIRQLAGDDHGHYENIYGDHDHAATPRGIGVEGKDARPFRSSGLRITVGRDGSVTGLAYLRDNGGHYEDVYMKTAEGWRIKERKYVAAAPAAHNH